MAVCEFEASLVYRVSSRTVEASQRNPVLKKIFFFIEFFFMCMSVSLECMYVHHVHACGSGMPEEGIRSLGHAFTDGCETPYKC